MRDTDYLDWAERPRWSRAEAASLLNGKTPQQNDPDLTPFADLPSSMDPAVWIGAACSAGIVVDPAWEVLFPDSISASPASVLGEEPAVVGPLVGAAASHTLPRELLLEGIGAVLRDRAADGFGQRVVVVGA